MEYLRLHHRLPGVASIELNRPAQHNSLNEDLIKEFSAVLKELSQQEDITALILESNGTSFCAGADLNTMEKAARHGFQENVSDALALAHMLQALNDFPKPTIALVQGPALGGGIGLICCCDLVIASSKAWFCFSEVKMGLIPAVISPFVVAAIGQRQARRYFLTAERISVKKAQDIGLVHEITEHALYDAALPYLTQILKNGPQALGEAKKLIQNVMHESDQETLRAITANHIAQLRAGEEGMEGIRAFLEKRIPRWQVKTDPSLKHE